jgi:ABC-type xylose transport system substrate-binding protein
MHATNKRDSFEEMISNNPGEISEIKSYILLEKFQKYLKEKHKRLLNEHMPKEKNGEIIMSALELIEKIEQMPITDVLLKHNVDERYHQQIKSSMSGHMLATYSDDEFIRTSNSFYCSFNNELLNSPQKKTLKIDYDNHVSLKENNFYYAICTEKVEE